MKELVPSHDHVTFLDELHRVSWNYFWPEGNPDNGLIPDSTQPGSPASIAAVGFALTVYPIVVERGLLSRADAAERTLTTLRFFWYSPQSQDPDATGYRGFYYHFLDMDTGRRAWRSELSTIDTALLVAGALTAAQYFDRDDDVDVEIRGLAEAIYRRVDWQWAQDGGRTVTMGWKPESGFLDSRWLGYSEALILYVLGLGSPTHPLPPESYTAWTETYEWRRIYDYEVLYAGPLFIHQFSHVWIDFRDIQDAYMRARRSDYFENSRRATYIQRAYACRNPKGFAGYGERCWGFTASDGPGPCVREIDGRRRRFFGYQARGAPFGPDDGTVGPWAVISSLPFAPEIVVPTLIHMAELHAEKEDVYGFECSFNPTFRADDSGDIGWVSQWHFGINHGPMVAMLDNYFTGLVWRLMRACPAVVAGLGRAGFSGGWLEGARATRAS